METIPSESIALTIERIVGEIAQVAALGWRSRW